MTINVTHFYYSDLSYYFIHKNMSLNYVNKLNQTFNHLQDPIILHF